jgi:hypothetical protein
MKTILSRSNGRYSVTVELHDSWCVVRRFPDGTWTMVESFVCADSAVKRAEAEMPESAVHPLSPRREPIRRADGLLTTAFVDS